MKGIIKAASYYKSLNDPKAISHLNRSLSSSAKKMYNKKLMDLNDDEWQHAYHNSIPKVLKKLKPGTYTIVSHQSPYK